MSTQELDDLLRTDEDTDTSDEQFIDTANFIRTVCWIEMLFRLAPNWKQIGRSEWISDRGLKLKEDEIYFKYFEILEVLNQEEKINDNIVKEHETDNFEEEKTLALKFFEYVKNEL